MEKQKAIIMKRSTLLLLLMLFVCGVRADEVKLLGDNTYCLAMSPNGNYLVGYNPTKVEFGMGTESFVYNMSKETLNWITTSDPGKWETSGLFRDVNDNGMLCGSVKDLKHVVEFYGDVAPTNVAAVYENGKITQLPYGDIDTTKIRQHEDGTFACSLSNDGKVVVGYCKYSNFAYSHPCKWTRTANGSWKLDILPLPEGYSYGLALNVSSDGRTIGGLAISKGSSIACYWVDGQCHVVTPTGSDVKLAKAKQMRMIDISPNGKYFIVSLSARSDYRLYDVSKAQTITLPTFESNDEMRVPTVTDSGDVFGAMIYGALGMGGMGYYRNFWYQHSSGRIFDFTYYTYLFNPQLRSSFPLNYEDQAQAFPCSVSANGNIIAGNKDVYTALGQTPNAWFLSVKQHEVEIPATPDKPNGESKALHQVSLTWKKDKTNYRTWKLKGYNVYCDGEKAATLKYLNDEMATTLKDVEPGYRNFSIEAIYNDKEGKEMLSPRSNPIEIAIPESYYFPLFENFERGSLNANYWTTSTDYGDYADREWTVAAQIGHDGTIGLSTGACTFTPYSASLVSRPLDASQAKKVKCSFLILCQQEAVKEGKDFDATKDTLSIEYTIDGGNTWQSGKDWTVEQLPRIEGILTADLSKQLAGKTFQLRFRKHGKGALGYYFYLDNIMIGSGNDVKAPEGLTGKVMNKEVFLMWKNTRNAYALSYICEPESPGYTLGNEGKELIGANKFTPTELSPYDGKYLTSVSAHINYYDDVGEDQEIHAAVVVFENGKLICEQEMEDIKFNETTTQKLDKPIKIDGTKELIVGIKVHDYSAEQIPLSYESSTAFVHGKSDLYSEDNGKTWKTVWDFYEGDPQLGSCCWKITGNVNDQPVDVTAETEDELVGYNVFRNGVQLNINYIPDEATHFIDKQPLEKADYSVVAYFNDGKESKPSAPFVVDLTAGIDPLFSNSMLLVDKSAIRLNVEGKLRLYAVDGHLVAKGTNGIIPLRGIHSGIYIVWIECNNRRFTQKIVINN
jgi:putative BNR/asp-box repeat-containing domain protein